MRIHRGSDGWGRDSYAIPQYAVVGASDCGAYSDSPAPTSSVADELDDFRKILRANHIRSRIVYTQSGNLFMLKRWVVVHSRDFFRANALADTYLKEHQTDTRWIHDAA